MLEQGFCRIIRGHPTHSLGIEIFLTNKLIVVFKEQNIDYEIYRYSRNEEFDKPKWRMNPSEIISNDPDTRKNKADRCYHSMVGSLLYAILKARPDKATAASILELFVSIPERINVATAQSVLKYLCSMNYYMLQHPCHSAD